MEENHFLLQVTCMTYNQANYITDAMDGFAMQQTSFPFVCIIVDDASTDGEPDVIKKYLDDNFDTRVIGLATEDETDEYLRIYAQHKENKNCYFCVLLLKYNHYSIGKPKTRNLAGFTKTVKYIALCEGDDYWTDPRKLQRQVDFLEGHPDFSLCFHKVRVWEEKEGIMVDDFITREVAAETCIQDLAEGNYIHTPSVVYRRDDRILEFRGKIGSVSAGDYVSWMACASIGKIWKMDECMAVYRFGSGIWSSKSQIQRLVLWCSVLDRLYVVVEDKKAIEIIEKQIIDSREGIFGFIEEMDEKEKQLNDIKRSYAYRLGKLLLKPFSWIKNVIVK